MHIQTVSCIQHDCAICAVGLCSLNSAMANRYRELISARWS